jgi:hypothetical protein
MPLALRHRREGCFQMAGKTHRVEERMSIAIARELDFYRR